MSQLITALPVGAEIKILETIDNVDQYVPHIIVSTGVSNPYGSDKVLLIRKYSNDTTRYNSTTDSKYEGSEIDSKLQNETLNRMSSEIKSAIATTTVVCYDYPTQQTYTIARKLFLLASKEIGGNADDGSTAISYFTATTRKYYNKATGDTAGWWTRTPISTSRAAIGTISGTVGDNAVGGSSQSGKEICLREAFNLVATTLVSDEPDEDGYYTLIPDPTDPYVYVRFDASLGTVSKTPLKIRVDLTTEGNPEITSLQVCNNYGDTEPTWETMTFGEAHTFTNTTKETANWEIGVKVVARGENTIRVYEPFAIIQTEVD